jgi:hypothetical protein
MAMHFEWRVKEELLPVKAIYHNPQTGMLTVRFNSPTEAEEVEKRLKGFDKHCEIDGQVYVMKRGSSPQQLGSFLLEQGWIDQACYDELQVN